MPLKIVSLYKYLTSVNEDLNMKLKILNIFYHDTFYYLMKIRFLCSHISKDDKVPHLTIDVTFL